MSVFKKFTDFCGGIAAFSAIFYLFREFMSFQPRDEVESLIQKLKLFLSDEPQLEYRPYLLLILLFLVSLTLSLIFHRLPYLAFPVSLLPLACATDMLSRKEIYEYPMLYVILGALHTFGILWECIRRDREDLRQRSALALNLGDALVAGVSFLIWSRPRVLEGVTPTEAKFFDRIPMYALQKGESFAVFKTAAIVFLVLGLIGFLLWELHYLHALFAIGASVYMLVLLARESFAVYATALPTLAIALAVGRLAVMLSCKPSERKMKKFE